MLHRSSHHCRPRRARRKSSCRRAPGTGVVQCQRAALAVEQSRRRRVPVRIQAVDDLGQVCRCHGTAEQGHAQNDKRQDRPCSERPFILPMTVSAVHHPFLPSAVQESRNEVQICCEAEKSLSEKCCRSPVQSPRGTVSGLSITVSMRRTNQALAAPEVWLFWPPPRWMT